MSVNELIEAAFNKNGTKFEETFNAVMREKVMAALDVRLSSLAEAEQEDEIEDEDEAEDEAEDDSEDEE